ncbi:MAG: hypothetical protein ACKVY0_03335 [Prosthecobacter sp.]|uniref:hypothetical protein n=1 Tax=Prosthecobacter sp. TaxID=1965333 RepID=UPI0039014232
MKFTAILSALIVTLLLVACGSVELAKSDAPSLVVDQDEERVCGQGKILFPAGEYRAEVAAANGIYYKAPKRIRTLGVLIGRSEEGGIFVANATGNPQAAWFGDPRDNVDERPGTLFGAIGWSAPKLWPYTPRIPYTLKK